MDHFKGKIAECDVVIEACDDSGIRFSWIPGTFPGTGRGLIHDNNLNPKPTIQRCMRRHDVIIFSI